MSSKFPKLQPQVEQEVRRRLASARSKFQDLTLGIYPESGHVTVEQGPADPIVAKENAPRLNEVGSEGISGTPDASKSNPEPASAVAQDHVEAFE